MGSGGVFPTLGLMPCSAMLAAAPGDPGHHPGEFSTSFFVQGQHSPITGCGLGLAGASPTMTLYSMNLGLHSQAGKKAPESGVVGETQISPNGRAGPCQGDQRLGRSVPQEPEMRLPRGRRGIGSRRISPCPAHRPATFSACLPILLISIMENSIWVK